MTTSPPPLVLTIDRSLRIALTDQIRNGIRAAIVAGVLPPGARLPSWQDLSSQLGVARGTVRTAYERLIDEGLLHSSGAAGTHVAAEIPAENVDEVDRFASLQSTPAFFAAGKPGLFQMGLPADDAFPAKLWARIHRRAVDAGALHTRHQDPRGTEELRQEVAAHLAIARGLRCLPGQIFITSSYRGALGLILQALPQVLKGTAYRAWVEEPGFPATRHGLRLAGFQPVGVRVDGEGADISLADARDVVLAVVTPGQQAPLGHTLSPVRRQALLDWAQTSGGWIIEDDYLGELQLEGRAAPALAAQDHAGRVLHIGSFSKTISPAVGIGFVVAPEPLVGPLLNVVTWLSPPPNYVAQAALATFLREGHYLRHLRRMKQLYAARRAAVMAALTDHGQAASPAGLSVHLALPAGVDEAGLLPRLRAEGFSPAPLSPWYDGPAPHQGLVLGISNALPSSAQRDVARLLALIADDQTSAARSQP